MRINNTTIEIDAHSPALKIYNVVVDIVRPVKVRTSTGPAESELVLAGGIAAHIKWRRGGEKVMFDKDTHLLDATLHCRVIAGTTIKTTDRVKYNGDTYEIVDVVNVNNLNRLLSIDLKKVE